MKSDVKLETLHPFFHRRSDRQRLILYLIADGYSVPALSRMTIGELNAMDLPDEIVIYRDRVLDIAESEDDNDPVFVYPGGRVMGYSDFYRIVSKATEATLGYELSHKQFAEQVQSKGKRRRLQG